MTTHRAILSTAFAAVALLALAPSAATAQSGGISDVIQTGRAHGVELSPETRAWIAAQGPDAFEFRNVWQRRVERVRANRAAFDASQRELPHRGAAFTTTTAELQAAGAVVDGTFRMPVLLGLPSDVSAPHAIATYQDRLFGTGAGTYSLTSLYDEMSGGLFEMTGQVYDWESLPQTTAYYYNNPNAGLNDFGRTPEFIAAVLTASDPDIDFGLYDNDGPDGVPNSGDDDGYVDLAAFLYPSYGRECGGPGIWAHRYTYQGWTGTPYATNDASAEGGAILVSDYIIQGGIECEATEGVVDVGLIAHEFGHGIGLPDLYDTDVCQGSGTRCDDGSLGQGVGEWSLMGSGNWNEPEAPAHMDAHSKAFLGWIDVVTIAADTALTIAPMLESGVAYRVDLVSAPGEYFLLENRQRIGSDVNLNGTGLLIWHIDSVQYANRQSSNTVNNVALRKGVDLEEADGLRHLDVSSDPDHARGDAGDSWPGSSNRTTFDPSSTPNSNTNTAGASLITITDIVETAGADITLVVDLPDMVTYGDVNADEAVTEADLDVVTSFVIGETGPDYSFIGLADVDDDGDTDAVDAYIIHAYLDGIATPGFRVGQQGLE